MTGTLEAVEVGSLSNIHKGGPALGHLWPRFGALQSPAKLIYFISLPGGVQHWRFA